MLSYRYMHMDMAGSRDGTDGLSVAEIVSPTGHNFRVTPTAMPMRMHMIGAMYAPTDELTLMAMLPVVDTYMDRPSLGGAPRFRGSRSVISAVHSVFRNRFPSGARSRGYCVEACSRRMRACSSDRN